MPRLVAPYSPYHTNLLQYPASSCLLIITSKPATPRCLLFQSCIPSLLSLSLSLLLPVRLRGRRSHCPLLLLPLAACRLPLSHLPRHRPLLSLPPQPCGTQDGRALQWEQQCREQQQQQQRLQQSGQWECCIAYGYPTRRFWCYHAGGGCGREWGEGEVVARCRSALAGRSDSG